MSTIFKKFAAPLLAIALVAVMGVSLLTNARTAHAAANTISAMSLGLGSAPTTSASTTNIIPAWSGGSAIGFILTGTATDTWTSGIVLTGPTGTTWATPVATSCVIIVVATGVADQTALCGVTVSGTAATIQPTSLATPGTATFAATSKVTVALGLKTPNNTASGGLIALTYTGGTPTGGVAAGTYGTLGAGKDFLLAWSTSTTAPTFVPVTAYSGATATADAAGAGGALCAFAATTVPGTATVGLPITFTVSLGVVSTGTAKSAVAVTGTTGSVCTNYRGGGGVAATDTAIGSNSLVSNVVDTLSVTLTAPTGSTAAKMTMTAPSNTAVAPTVTNTFISATTCTNFSVQVTDSAGLGVNSQVVLITVDKGALTAGFQGSISTAKAVTGTSATGPRVYLDGVNKAGVIPMTFCGNQLDAAGKATITAQNISTSMANVTSTVTSGRQPGIIKATVEGGVIKATVTDASGNVVADGTPIQFTISSQAGAVSSACTVSSNGVASSAVALVSSTASVIVTASYATSGSAATCAATGSETVSATVVVTTGGSAPVVTGAGTFAAAPVFSAAKLAQVVFNGGTVAQLDTAISGGAATGAWAQDSKGVFALYIVNGGFVNDAFKAAFPTGFAGVTALTVVGK